MKLFETPVVEVVKFAVEDVITTSNGGFAPPPAPNPSEDDFCAG